MISNISIISCLICFNICQHNMLRGFFLAFILTIVCFLSQSWIRKVLRGFKYIDVDYFHYPFYQKYWTSTWTTYFKDQSLLLCFSVLFPLPFNIIVRFHLCNCRELQYGTPIWTHFPQKHSLPSMASTNSLTFHRRNSEVGWYFDIEVCLVNPLGILLIYISVLPFVKLGWVCRIIVYTCVCIKKEWLWTVSFIHRSVPGSSLWESSSLLWTECKGAPRQIWLEGQGSRGTSPGPTSSKFYTWYCNYTVHVGG